MFEDLLPFAAQGMAQLAAPEEGKSALEKAQENKGLNSVQMNADGSFNIKGHQDILKAIVSELQNSGEYKKKAMAYDQIEGQLRQGLARIDQRQQFVDQHPILSVLARVGSVAGMDPRMPPIVRGLAAAAGEQYPGRQELMREREPILSELARVEGQKSQQEMSLYGAAEKAVTAGERAEYQRGLLEERDLSRQEKERADKAQEQLKSEHEKNLQAWRSGPLTKAINAKADYEKAMARFHQRMLALREKAGSGRAVSDKDIKDAKSDLRSIESKVLSAENALRGAENSIPMTGEDPQKHLDEVNRLRQTVNDLRKEQEEARTFLDSVKSSKQTASPAGKKGKLTPQQEADAYLKGSGDRF